MRKKLLCTLFIMIMIFTLVYMHAVSAPPTHTISVIPDTIIDPTLTPGENFTVSIHSNYTGSDIWGYEFTLSYNPEVIQGGIRNNETWNGDGSTTAWNTTYPAHIDSQEVYVNSSFKTPLMQGNDTWSGTGSAVYVTTESPVVELSEEVYVNAILNTRNIAKTDTWPGDGSTTQFDTTEVPVVPGSEKVRLNATDTWTGNGTTTMFNTTYTPIIDFTEIVRLDGALKKRSEPKIDIWTGNGTETVFNTTQIPVVPGSEYVHVNDIPQERGVNYTINYDTGAITFTVAPPDGAEVKASYNYGHYTINYLTGAINFTEGPPSNGVEVKAQYEILQEKDVDYTINYNTGNITFVVAPANGREVRARYEYGHYRHPDYPSGTITFNNNTVPGVGSVVNIRYTYEVYTITYSYASGVGDYSTITFANTPGASDVIEVKYLYGGVTNGDLISGPFFATFYPGLHNITAGKLKLTYALMIPGLPATGPGILANVTFQVVGYGSSNITLGPETKLKALGYDIIPDQLEHGYFRNMGLGDANGDGIVDIFDVGTISAHWTGSPPGPLGYGREADINLDESVNITDINITSANWGNTYP